MTNTITTPSRFASDLKMAIAVSGKSIEEITDNLSAYKIHTTTEVLHGWETGEIAPRAKTSERAITALEKILELPLGTLLSSFSDVLENTAADLDHSGVSSHYSNELLFENFHSIDEQTNWNNEVYREELNENILISSDFRKIRQAVRAGVRVPYDKQGTLHVSTFWDPSGLPAADDIGIYEIDGAIVGETITERSSEGIVKTTTLLLPEDVQPGDLHYISYEHRFTSQTPQTSIAQRAFSWHLNSYSCSVTFLGRTPNDIEWILTSIDTNSFSAQKNIYTRPLTPTGNTVTVSINNVKEAIGTITWD